MDVTLHTRRLVLRQPRPDDAPRIVKFLNNFAVSGKLSRVPYPYKLSDAEWWLGNWRADKPVGETGFTIDLPGEGLIGHCGFHPDLPGTVIGYWLAEPFWNRGFMSEAAAAAIACISRSPTQGNSIPASSPSTRHRWPSRRSSALPRSAPPGDIALHATRTCAVSTRD